MAQAGDKKPRSEKRRAAKIVQKRVTEAQHAEFVRRGEAAGYDTPKDYLEAFVLGNVVIKRRERQEGLKLYAELSKQGPTSTRSPVPSTQDALRNSRNRTWRFLKQPKRSTGR